MKTARQWFQCLRPDLRKKAIKNTIRLESNYYKFSHALKHSFMWSTTSEGYRFWSVIYYEAYDIEEGYKPDIKPKKYKKGDIVKFKDKTFKCLK